MSIYALKNLFSARKIKLFSDFFAVKQVEMVKMFLLPPICNVMSAAKRYLMVSGRTIFFAILFLILSCSGYFTLVTKS